MTCPAQEAVIVGGGYRESLRYKPVISGEGFELPPLGRSKRAWKVLRVACCDCGLIHSLAFAIERNGNLGIAVRVEKRATAAHRRAAQFEGLRLPRTSASKK